MKDFVSRYCLTWASSKPFTRLVQSIIQDEEEAEIHEVSVWFACVMALIAIACFVASAEIVLTVIPAIWERHPGPGGIMLSFFPLILAVFLFLTGLGTVADIENMRIKGSKNGQ